MIKQWRTMFQLPSAFYAVVQLSTWFPNPRLLAELRDQQLESANEIPNFAYATNADYGAGGNIHPPYVHASLYAFYGLNAHTVNSTAVHHDMCIVPRRATPPHET